MSDVTPTSSVSSPALAALTRASRPAGNTETGPVRTGDKVELSKAAQYISKLVSKNDVRGDLVDRVKSELAAGTYESDAKVDAAIEELLSDL